MHSRKVLSLPSSFGKDERKGQEIHGQILGSDYRGRIDSSKAQESRISRKALWPYRFYLFQLPKDYQRIDQKISFET